jgi:hypothetical protein
MNGSSVADLTVEELRDLIREVVAEAIADLFADPDSGLELHEEFQHALRGSLQSSDAHAQASPAEDVARRLGLEW